MAFQKIEDEALHLPREQRAELIQKLVLSLDTPTMEELREDWLAEARDRADQLDRGEVKAIPAAEVFRTARKLTE